jgi:hypothetical protein
MEPTFGATYGFHVHGTILKRFFFTDVGVNVEFDIHAIVMLYTTQSFTPSYKPQCGKRKRNVPLLALNH